MLGDGKFNDNVFNMKTRSYLTPAICLILVLNFTGLLTRETNHCNAVADLLLSSLHENEKNLSLVEENMVAMTIRYDSGLEDTAKQDAHIEVLLSSMNDVTMQVNRLQELGEEVTKGKSWAVYYISRSQL
jgi:hypothetical protein